MTLRQLVSEVVDNHGLFKVSMLLKELYYSDIEAENIERIFKYYSIATDGLIKCVPEKTNLYKIIICKEIDDFSEPPEEYTDVRLSNIDETELFCTDLTPWRKLIDLEIDNKINLSKEEVLAHILYDITFYGYTETEIEQEQYRLSELAEQATNEFLEGKLIPWEDVLEEATEVEKENKD